LASNVASIRPSIRPKIRPQIRPNIRLQGGRRSAEDPAEDSVKDRQAENPIDAVAGPGVTDLSMTSNSSVVCASGYLKAVWPEIFGPVFPGFSAEPDHPRPPRSPGPAPHVNFHEKSTPQTNSKAVSWQTKIPSDCLQVPNVLRGFSEQTHRRFCGSGRPLGASTRSNKKGSFAPQPFWVALDAPKGTRIPDLLGAGSGFEGQGFLLRMGKVCKTQDYSGPFWNAPEYSGILRVDVKPLRFPEPGGFVHRRGIKPHGSGNLHDFTATRSVPEYSGVFQNALE
jgi:hypothetical protein